MNSRYRSLTRKKNKRPAKVVFIALLAVTVFFFIVQATSSPSQKHSRLEMESVLHRLDSLQKQISLEEKRISRLRFNREGEIRAGQGMFQALSDLGVSHQMRLQMVNTLSDSVELLTMVAGEKISVELDPHDTTRIRTFTYSPNPAVIHKLAFRDSAFVYERVELPTTIRHRLIEGVIQSGSSLDQTLREKGITPAMVGVVNGVLLCKISFRTDAREGDRFKVLLRERFFQDSVRIDGQVLYTSYDGSRAGFHEAFRYDDGDPKSSYTAHYTEKGEALIHSGLRYPLDRLHISSSYGMRIHPVSGRRKMHWGVDYRAPTGTPIYSVAPGVVIKSAYNSSNGHYIAIRHPDRYISYYLHLHRRLATRGQTVRSGQIIGRVGNTGISTGPHLHFGFKRPNGRWMNPLHKRMIATPKLQGQRLARMTEQAGQIRQLLDSLQTQQPSRVVAMGDDN
ncbi:MAG: M23 family metallopeptidase [Chitinivibrionales bacterium]